MFIGTLARELFCYSTNVYCFFYSVTKHFAKSIYFFNLTPMTNLNLYYYHFTDGKKLDLKRLSDLWLESDKAST